DFRVTGVQTCALPISHEATENSDLDPVIASKKRFTRPTRSAPSIAQLNAKTSAGVARMTTMIGVISLRRATVVRVAMNTKNSARDRKSVGYGRRGGQE